MVTPQDSSTYSKVRITLQDCIIHFGSETFSHPQLKQKFSANVLFDFLESLMQLCENLYS